MLPDLVMQLKAHGYRFVTVHEYLQLVAGTIMAKRGTARLELLPTQPLAGTTCR
jgi:hypothetical protein